MNAGSIFPKPRSQAAKRLTRLAVRLSELKVEARVLHEKTAADASARADLTSQLHAAQAKQHAFGDAAAAVKTAERELAKLEKTGGERAVELRIVHDAAATVEGEVKVYARQNATELSAELRVDAQAAAERLAAAAVEFGRAHAQYVDAGVRGVELQRLVDPEQLRNLRVPDLPPAMAEFARRTISSTSSIPLPVPSAPGAVIGTAELRVAAEAAGR